MCTNGGHSLRILFFIFDAAAEVWVEAGFGAIVLIGNTSNDWHKLQWDQLRITLEKTNELHFENYCFNTTLIMWQR